MTRKKDLIMFSFMLPASYNGIASSCVEMNIAQLTATLEIFLYYLIIRFFFKFKNDYLISLFNCRYGFQLSTCQVFLVIALAG